MLEESEVGADEVDVGPESLEAAEQEEQDATKTLEQALAEELAADLQPDSRE